MGIFEWITTLFSNDEEEEPSSEEKIEFVTADELADYKDNIVGRLDTIISELTTIRELIPDKEKHLTNRINRLKASLMDGNIEAVNVMVEVEAIEEEFKSAQNYAKAEYRISEIEKQNKQMKECFLESIDDIQSLRDKIKSMKRYIKSIQEEVDQERESRTLSFNLEQERRFQVASFALYRKRCSI